MATEAPNVTERAEHPDDDLHAGDHPSDRTYVSIAIILALITGAEIATFYFEDTLGDALVPILLVMMVVKFSMVAMWFMHLKFDSRLFTRLFVAGIATAVAVYVITLTSFEFFA